MDIIEVIFDIRPGLIFLQWPDGIYIQQNSTESAGLARDGHFCRRYDLDDVNYVTFFDLCAELDRPDTDLMCPHFDLEVQTTETRRLIQPN